MHATVKSRLPEFTGELLHRVDVALEHAAHMIEHAAKDRVPVNTGDLRDSIHVDKTGPAEYAVIAGNNKTFYGHMVEHGTSHTGPRPFLIPAMEASRETTIRAVSLAMRTLE